MSETSSHLRQEQLRFLKEGVQFIERKEPELQELVSQLDFVKLQSICDDNFNWAYLYELPTTQFFSIVFALLGWLPILAEAINSGVNPNQAVINQVNKMQEDPETFAKSLFNFEHEPATIEDLKKVRFNGIFTVSDFLILLYAVHLQGISLRKHGKLLTDLVDDVRRGKEESFWLALQIDPTILSCSVFSNRMSIAYIQKDYEFFKLLGNAVKTKWKKNKTKTELDPLRVMLHALNETKILNNLSMDAADKLFIQELEVYSNDGEDPARSLFRFINRWKKTL